jgi:pimeloyl-ACP methyl ester carboxylesterase
VSARPETAHGIPRTRPASTRAAAPASEFSRVRVVVLGLIAAIATLGIVFWTWIDAERRAVIVFAEASHTPVLSFAVDLATRVPHTEETTAAGAPATLVRPGGGHRWPAVLLLPGTVDQGRANVSVQRLARALARAGYLVVVPDLPGMTDGEVVEETVRSAVNAALDVAHRSDVRGGTVALAGAWAGGTLALLAAEDPLLAPRVSSVTAIAPWAAGPNLLRLATTGFVLTDGNLQPYRADPGLALFAARSLVAALGPGTDRDQLLQLLQGVPRGDPDPLRVVRGLALDHLSPGAAAVVSLLTNTHAPSFDSLYAALPQSLHAAIEHLSPLVGASQLQAPVEVATAPNDRFVPPAEARALRRASSLVHVTVTGAVRNGLPEPSLGDALSANGFLVRALHATR